MDLATVSPLIRAVTSRPWAIMPERADDIAAVLTWHSMGERRSLEEIEAIKGPRHMANGIVLPMPLAAAMGPDPMGYLRDLSAEHEGGVRASRDGSGYERGAAVAVINVFGIIAQHARQVDNISGPGGTSTERVGAAMRAAMADPSISAVVLQVDSPGGNVFGVQALADLIHSYRGQKPIIAHANSLMASAAYWIASAADEIAVAPGGQVGSVGVVALHQDVSQAAEKAGVRFSYVYAGQYKVEGNPYEPLGEEARSAIQADVDAYYADFVKSLARNRNRATKDVLEGFGKGRTLNARDAVKAGMADRIETFEDTLRRVASGRGGRGGRRAEGEGLDLAAMLAGSPQGAAALGSVMSAALVQLLARGSANAGLPGTLAPEPPAPPAAEAPEAPAPDAPETEHPQGEPGEGGEPPADAGPQETTGPEGNAPGAPENAAGDDAEAREREAYRRRRHAHLKRRFE